MQQPEEGVTAVEKVAEEPQLNEKPVSSSASTLAKDKETTASVLNDDDALYAHLPTHEKDILKRQLDAPPVKITFFGLYRYASHMDILIIVVSALCAIAAGAALPLFTVSIPFRIWRKHLTTPDSLRILGK
jgi:ATP-binding cassette subfamily B (MDR/TAP) protein 1